jgi:RNA polymerase sigma-54 factor
MVLIPRLEQRQSQALVMTPQLQQAIKMLQLSNMDLSAYVEQELQENPMLERDEMERDEAIDDPTDMHADDLVTDGEIDPAALEEMDFDIPQEAVLDSDMGLDTDVDNIYTHEDTPAPEPTAEPESGWNEPAFAEPQYPNSGGGFDTLEANLEQTLSEHISLRDHLLEQLSLEVPSNSERMIGVHLIDLLDEAGYLSGGYEDVADTLGCSNEDVEQMIERLQTFDPPGIFARNLKECLALQLRELDRLDPCMATFIEHLDLLAKREFKKLAAICQCDSEDVNDMITEIRALNPKPAADFDVDVAQPVTPDVLMRAAPSGGWIIELNSASLPRVLVNNQYYAQIRGQVRSKEDKQYVTEQFQSANWLVKALHQRATTILKVATELVVQQSQFFTHGVQHLKPLVLRDIADAIEMHESTVSRVTSNKYMATPRGIFELKYFFTPAIASSAGGEAHSAEAVRHRIKLLIDEEDPKKILSDDKLVTLLKVDGVDIARRTVAKYRESMRISSSVQRRREKNQPDRA